MTQDTSFFTVDNVAEFVGVTPEDVQARFVDRLAEADKVEADGVLHLRGPAVVSLYADDLAEEFEREGITFKRN